MPSALKQPPSSHLGHGRKCSAHTAMTTAATASASTKGSERASRGACNCDDDADAAAPPPPAAEKQTAAGDAHSECDWSAKRRQSSSAVR